MTLPESAFDKQSLLESTEIGLGPVKVLPFTNCSRSPQRTPSVGDEVGSSENSHSFQIVCFPTGIGPTISKWQQFDVLGPLHPWPSCHRRVGKRFEWQSRHEKVASVHHQQYDTKGQFLAAENRVFTVHESNRDSNKIR